MSKRNPGTVQAGQSPSRKRPAARNARLMPTPSPKAWMFLKAMLILIAGTVALSPVLGASWYGDDSMYLTGNSLLHEPHRLWKAWFVPGSFIEYYPIEQTVQWVQWKFWGLDNPFPYLVTNLVLHLTSALLVWRLLSKLGLKLAWLGGLIFAIHPVMVDSVGVSNELKNTLSLPPFLLAMCFYLDFENTGESRSYARALLLFLVAMLCKITMFFFPFVILLYAWWKRGRVTVGDLKAAAPFMAISLVLGLMTLHAGRVYEAANYYGAPFPIPLGGLLSRIALAGLTLTFYFGHFFLPRHLMIFYPMWKIDPPAPELFLPWLAIGLAIAICWFRRGSWGRPALIGLAFFALGLVPFLGLFRVSFMRLAWVHDHLLYIPIIGLIGLVVAALERVGAQLSARLRSAGVAFVILGMIWLGFQTYAYGTLFVDREQLWRYNLRYNPDHWYMRYALGVVLAGKNEYEAAIEETKEASRLNPAFLTARVNLGLYLFNLGKYPESVACYQEVLQADPLFMTAHLNLAESLMMEGKNDEAIDEFNVYLKAEPDSAEAHSNLSSALAQEGRIPEAIEEAKMAIQLAPDNDEFKNWLETLKNVPPNAVQKR